MKFYNREDELQELNLLRNTSPAMIVLTGRRRVGKTELIKKFLEDSIGVYFFVDSEKSEKMLINEFSAQVKECFDLGEYVKIEDWNTLLKPEFESCIKNMPPHPVFCCHQPFLNKLLKHVQ